MRGSFGPIFSSNSRNSRLASSSVLTRTNKSVSCLSKSSLGTKAARAAATEVRTRSVSGTVLSNSSAAEQSLRAISKSARATTTASFVGSAANAARRLSSSPLAKSALTSTTTDSGNKFLMNCSTTCSDCAPTKPSTILPSFIA